LAGVLGAPAYQQTVPYGAHFPSEHPAFMGALSRDQKQVRNILAEHDLLIVAGADVLRMSVWQETDPLPDDLPLVQLGQLDWEMGKNYPAEIAIRADLKATLDALIPVLEEAGGEQLRAAAETRIASVADRNWSSKCKARRAAASGRANASPIANDYLMMQIVDALPEDAVLVNEGLTAATTLLDMLPFRDVGGFHAFASGGIGWAIAAAIGIQLARPERPLVAVIGDGSAMYTVQALWTAAHLNLPITYVIANNQGYRILKQRLQAFHGNDHFIGMDLDDPPIDFCGLARSLGLDANRIDDPGEIAGALRDAIASRRPTLLEVMVEREV
ncbi:MAG: thiamine pyrophosphate-dependent enzyme, partial [Pseudomonadota bacterium]